jgi:DNA-binding NtrC family response regulator
MSNYRILIVDDDDTMLARVSFPMRNIKLKRGENEELFSPNFTFEIVTSEENMWRRLEINTKEQDPSLKIKLILLDLVLDEYKPEDLTGLRILPHLCRKYPEIPVIVATNSADWDTGNKAITAGAKIFLPKNKYDSQEWANHFYRIIVDAQNAQEVKQLKSEKQERQYQQHPEFPFLGISPQIESIRKSLKILTEQPDLNVLILGETGVGKNVAARFYHYNCPNRKQFAFEEIHFSTIGQDMIEAELFGAKKGAYTGADSDRTGRIEMANGGVVFLDEIGDLTLINQGKLLQFLNDRIVRPMKSTRDVKVDVGVLSATNKDLEDLVEAGTFREDLYGRINGHTIVIPPLRDRREDIEPLILHFLKLKTVQELDQMMDKSVKTILTEQYHWPMNIRELRNVLGKLKNNMRTLDQRTINLQCLTEGILRTNKKLSTADNSSSGTTDSNSVSFGLEMPPDLGFKEKSAWLEMDSIERALKKTNGRKQEAAELLGLSHADNIYTRIKKFKKLYPTWIPNFYFINKYYN